ncbi:MAG: (d)CMP kinase [Ignavibacteriaceae bacterium]|nr:(d)CMP kinase [Ignavibacteriaceae bacterium]
MPKKIIIAIDGPAGSGKSSTAKLAAEKLNFTYIDTGAMYRIATLIAIEENLLGNQLQLLEKLKSTDFDIRVINGKVSVTLEGRDVTSRIREFDVNENVSQISKIPELREMLVELQRKLGASGNVVMEGRDIGSVVFPNADLKFFFTASIEERAKRRIDELATKGIEYDFEEIKRNIIERDKIDALRDVSPLIKAPDAIEIDNSGMTLNDQVKLVVDKALEIIENE